MTQMEEECECCVDSCQCNDCLHCTEAPIRIPFAPRFEEGHFRSR